MSLHGVQCALADLFLHPHSRELHERDPAAFARGFDLNERDRAQLDALAASAVASYASTLVRKRAVEATKLLPQTHLVLGDRFISTFEEWARRARLPNGRRRYARDADGFCGYLLRARGLSAEQRAVVSGERRGLLRGGWSMLWRR